jgi:methyl-accepting chemotaxis protein-2 (aspartate sensor receptor)
MTLMNPSTTGLRMPQKLSVKVIAVLCTTLLVVLIAAMGLVSRIIWQEFYLTADEASLAEAKSAQGVAGAYMDSAQFTAERDFEYLQLKFASAPFRMGVPSTNDELADDQDAATDAPPASNPVRQLLWGEAPLNGNFFMVDAFTRERGGSVATIFERQGDDFMRITTSLLNAQGQRAFGTTLDRNHPAYPVMLRGEKYVGPATLLGRPFMTVYEPILENGQVVGILFTGTSTEEYLSRLRTQMLNTRVKQTGRVFAVNITNGPQRGMLFGLEDATARLDLENPLAREWLEAVAEINGSGELHPTWSPLAGADNQSERFVGIATLPVMGWAIVSDTPADEMLGTARHALILMWSGVASALILLTLAIIWTINRFVVRPVESLSHALGVLGQGDLTQPIRHQSNDEIGLLSQSMERFRETLLGSLLKIKQSADTVSSASQEIASGNDDLSQRTEEQASALEETAASMEEMASTVQHNADNATAANQLAAAASSVAQRGGQAVSEVVGSMHSISQSSQKMSDIISVIDGIAFQTNILALNAAVEAARAGEQGRGFAVVAGEVRTLAQRSAAAAKEIKGLIDESVEKVTQGTRQADQAGSTMQEVVSSISRVADMIGEISAASREQSEGVNQVGEAVSQMDQTTQQNAALVEEMAAAANSLSQQSVEMVQAMAFFQLGQASAAAPVARAKPVSRPIKPPAKPSAAKPTPKAKADALQSPTPVKAPALESRSPTSAPQPPNRKEPTLGANDDWTSF